jgi:hypothetical protein
MARTGVLPKPSTRFRKDGGDVSIFTRFK